MNEEKIIREEALEYYENSNINNPYAESSDVLRNLKSRLYDFYSSEFKAIFLDELNNLITENLELHRKKAHSGKADPDCQQEKQAERVLFYLKQELGTLPTVVHQRYSNKKEKKRAKVFVSYSHFDKEYLTEIQRHFKPFKNLIDFWDDSKIKPGQKWKEEIKKAIDETKVAILLVSTDFLGSDFISTDELPPLLEAAEKEGAVILTIVLKPCLFEEFDDLNQFQAMNPPSRPVSKMDLNEKEELFVNLVRQTRKILEE
ncbi:toll/interleukin-1 receptor domain-containing protein [Leeuwenhoekiella marinoflava]|uniref:TIR domain-containing protein n=2 Tax=Leeuwenhoekiella marinoflava TaxID=988 RepID=A0A4Q0PN13_9FLAO|nr:toll/interleukin-1 receptor domain-containing protein [Leeuwenhoekiella marinoflava]RXG31867.1 TIR domain-containing protein [Leeuwenhoekiella marinoflava]SHF02132.1 TIR domain-containing protein [Leeuwenhoekiella marinoflava DSM 3653]